MIKFNIDEEPRIFAAWMFRHFDRRSFIITYFIVLPVTVLQD